MMRFRTSLSTLLLLLLTSFTVLAQPSANTLGQLYMSGQLDAVIAQGENELRTNGEQPLVRMFVGRAYLPSTTQQGFSLSSKTSL
jgi:hypothetical protein